MGRRIRIFLRGMCLGMDPSFAISGARQLSFDYYDDEQRDDLRAVGDDLRAAMGKARRARASRATVEPQHA